MPLTTAMVRWSIYTFIKKVKGFSFGTLSDLYSKQLYHIAFKGNALYWTFIFFAVVCNLYFQI